ncbi:hypothetical protein L0156_10270 [bacterium]|nr:hypothetical protein [bacterium]
MFRVNPIAIAISTNLFKFELEEFRKTDRRHFFRSLIRLFRAFRILTRSITRLHWYTLAANIRLQFRKISSLWKKKESLEPYSIYELDLRSRTLNYLIRAGILTIPQVLVLNEEDLRRLIVGRTSLQEIKRVLGERNLELGMDPSHAVLLFPRSAHKR